jgi:TrmH family RNA methyltransferase
MVKVVLVEPEKSGNVGAVARVMANFGFKDLILIDPKCKHMCQTARNRAKHAQKVLKSTKTRTWKYLKKNYTLVATTAQLGTDYNIPRSPISPSQLSQLIADKKIRKDVAVVFGRESSGLSNEEILECDFVVTIPADKKYPVLNLSHSIAIILYELSKQKPGKTGEHIVFASKKEKEQLMKLLKKVLSKMKFATPAKKQTQIKVWKRMIGKSFLTKREAFALMGFFKKLI